jgi:two-component system sensor histidine kinase BaeS
MTARRRGLAAQTALAMAAVVAVALLLTGIVALRLIAGASRAQALDGLERQAQIIAGVAERQPALLRTPSSFPSRALVRRQQIRVVGVTRDGRPHGAAAAALTADDLHALSVGESVRGVRRLAGADVLLAGKPVTAGRGAGGAVALVQAASVARGVGDPARRRILAALLVGLAGAVVAAVLLSRRLARPLQDAAGAADDLAAGRRDVRLEPAGPTEVAQLAEALNSLAAALATSEGRQRDFLLSVSHELRTPLTTLRGFAEALADGVLAPADTAAAGRTMRAEAERLERLVADLLDLARLRAQDFRLEPVRVDVRDVLDAAAAAWAPRCRSAGVELRVERPAYPLVVTTDPARLRQVLDGLADNVLKVTPAGRPLVLAGCREADEAVLEVRDGGPGLTDDDLRVAFERSALHDRYRGERRVGAGVGLALVAGLVGRLGGRAQAGHAPEGGACFTVRLPLDAGGPGTTGSGP